MVGRWDRRGRTWKCRNKACGGTIFFIPDVYLEEQRKAGCPRCSKKSWKSVEYRSLFINEKRIEARREEIRGRDDTLDEVRKNG